MKLPKNSSIDSVAIFLNDAIEKKNSARIREAFTHIIKANGGHTYFSKKTHVTRQTVYNYLSGRSGMSLDFFCKVLKEVGLRLTIKRK